MSEREARSTRSCLLQLNSLPLLTVTLYPLSASRIAVAAPMPAPPPVTRALGIFWAEFENAAEVFLLFGLLAFFSENNAKLFTLFSFPFSLSFSPPPSLWEKMSSGDRVAVLARHLAGGRGEQEQQSSLEACPTAARSSALSLPPIDAAAMEAALDVDPAKRAMRRQVYSLFENRPDLMPACVEGMRKGQCEGGESVKEGRSREREGKGLSWKNDGGARRMPRRDGSFVVHLSPVASISSRATPLKRCSVFARHRRCRRRRKTRRGKPRNSRAKML